MNSSFWGVRAEEMSASSVEPSSLSSFLVVVLMVSTVPVSTEKTCSSTTSPSSSITGLPSSPIFLTQFFRSIPIPPVTPTVVRKMGEIPFVPPTIGAMLMNGT